MTIDAMRSMHSGKICVCRPHLRELKSHRVVTWQILQVVDNIETARAVLAHFDQDGITDAVAISPSKEIVIHSGLAARFFRVYYGMQ